MRRDRAVTAVRETPWYVEGRCEMSEVNGGDQSMARSKFEWGPDDVVLLSPEESRLAIAEHLEWLLARGPDSGSMEAPTLTDDDDH